MKRRNEKSLFHCFRKIYGQIAKADPSSYCYTEFCEINFVRDQWLYWFFKAFKCCHSPKLIFLVFDSMQKRNQYVCIILRSNLSDILIEFYLWSFHFVTFERVVYLIVFIWDETVTKFYDLLIKVKLIVKFWLWNYIFHVSM